MKFVPHSYQSFAIEYIKSHPMAAVLLDMEKGLRCSGSVCYGYCASKEEKGEWVIDEEAAAVVRRIFQSVLAGETVASIAKVLCAGGTARF